MAHVLKLFGKVQVNFLKPLTIFAFLLAILSFYQFDFERINLMLEVPWISGLAIVFHMFSIVILIMLFNILYYIFVKDNRYSSLLYAAGFAVAVVTYLMRLMTDLGGPGLLEAPLNLTSSTFAGGHLILFVLALIAENRSNVSKVLVRKHHLEMGLPLIPAVISIFILLIVYLNYDAYTGGNGISEMTALVINYLTAVILLVLMMLAFRHVYVEENYNYSSVVIAYICLFFAKTFAIIGFDYKIGAQLISLILNMSGFAFLLKYFYKSEIGDPLRDISNRENQITLYANNLERVLQKRMNDIFERNRRFTLELEYARNIQQSLLPEKRFTIKNTTFISGYFPCEDLSGDFYDIYRIDDNHIGMYILDVSGHGISAALMTMFCNNYIKSTERLIKRYRGLKPHKNLSNFYEEFNRMNFPDEMHMVIFFASYSLSDRILTYCSGGMNCIPFIITREGSFKMLDESLGFPICKFSDLYKPVYQSVSVELQTGDRVVFYTDGLIDLHKNRVMDQVGLEEFMADHIELSLKTLNEHLIGRIYPKVDKLKDDISYFVMEVN